MEFMGQQVQEVTCEIVVTRADGTVEDLGVVSRTIYEQSSLSERVWRRVKTWLT